MLRIILIGLMIFCLNYRLVCQDKEYSKIDLEIFSKDKSESNDSIKHILFNRFKRIFKDSISIKIDNNYIKVFCHTSDTMMISKLITNSTFKVYETYPNSQIYNMLFRYNNFLATPDNKYPLIRKLKLAISTRDTIPRPIEGSTCGYTKGSDTLEVIDILRCKRNSTIFPKDFYPCIHSSPIMNDFYEIHSLKRDSFLILDKFSKTKISLYNDKYELYIQLDKLYIDKWEVFTRLNIKKYICFVFDNKVIYGAKINEPITLGGIIIYGNKIDLELLKANLDYPLKTIIRIKKAAPNTVYNP